MSQPLSNENGKEPNPSWPQTDGTMTTVQLPFEQNPLPEELQERLAEHEKFMRAALEMVCCFHYIFLQCELQVLSKYIF